MTLELAPGKDSVDLGIVIRDWAATRRFYVETLGLEHVVDQPMTVGSKGTMHRVQCGSVMLKFIAHEKPRPAANPPGGIGAAYGLRYFTIWVADLDAVIATLASAGYQPVVPRVEARPGITIAMFEDPDGNWVEFLQPT